MRTPEPEPRSFWWPVTQLSNRWWPLVMRGGDEWMRRTIGVRLPGGMAFLCLWRFRDAVGPCARCGMWEPREGWPDDLGEHCMACHHELVDYARGCVCPSYLDAEDDEWPSPSCGLHAAA